MTVNVNAKGSIQILTYLKIFDREEIVWIHGKNTKRGIGSHLQKNLERSGKIWVESEPGKDSSFYSLSPIRNRY